MHIIWNEGNFPNYMITTKDGGFVFRVAFRVHRRAFDFGMKGWRPFARMWRVLLPGEGMTW